MNVDDLCITLGELLGDNWQCNYDCVVGGLTHADSYLTHIEILPRVQAIELDPKFDTIWNLPSDKFKTALEWVESKHGK